jgi:hypothetical protein
MESLTNDIAAGGDGVGAGAARGSSKEGVDRQGTEEGGDAVGLGLLSESAVPVPDDVIART